MSDDLRRCGTCDGLGEVFAMNGTGNRWSCPHCFGSGRVKREKTTESVQIAPLDLFAGLAMHAILMRGVPGAMSGAEIAECAARQAYQMIEELKKGEA